MKETKKFLIDDLFAAALEEDMKAEVKSYPSDEELEQRFTIPQKHIKQGLRKLKSRKVRNSLVFKTLQKVGLIFLVVAVLSFGVILMDDSARAAISKFFITWSSDFFEISFISDDAENNDADNNAVQKKKASEYIIKYIPKGFELTTTLEGINHIRYTYFNSEGLYFSVHISTTDIGSFYDNDELKIEYTEINGYDAIILEYTDSLYNTVIMGNENIEFSICGALEKKEIIKIAKNIK